jgi:hypothetical protein
MLDPCAVRWTQKTSRRKCPGPGRQCRGSAAVEFAVCLPVLVLMVFGSIEASSFIFLKQSLHVACYEGVREACKTGSTDASARGKAEAILESRRVNDFEIRFPEGVQGIARGETISCEISAPTGTNSPLAGDFLPARVLTARVVMLKE